ncbi:MULTISPECIES: hypothetical protein [Vibrio]|uniref:hypothetical protein n=1 Tax=Vibrio TaxID=662 RepID=UPI00078C8E59|nr:MULTISPECIES: hypothetical protein [Vibrio]BAU70882.1 hypothetical protein [Vibrio sp. 04Ya108]BBM67861.1 hypothetical protein VA249_45070 [Vibrio alfacsensis]BCN27031.1 hypothetical protein VYA_42230 [Vibrio alfacsensis]
MSNANKKVIGGYEFEAVRFKVPAPHWRLKLPNGEILDSGVGGFNGQSKPKLFESVEYTLQRLGEERFRSFMMLD